MIHLVLGGARSGKSRFALQQVMLNQALAARVDKVTFTAAGLPMTLKDVTQ